MTHLHHIAFRTANPERLVAFYRDLLELPVHKSDSYSTWFSLGAAMLMIESRSVDEPAYDPQSRELLCFGCMNSHERELLAARLESAGIQIEDRTEHTVYFRDPDGRRIGASDFPFTEPHSRVQAGL